MSGVFAAGLILLAAGSRGGPGGRVARWPRLMSVPYLLGAAGSGCLAAAAGAGVLAGGQARLAVGGWLGRARRHANAGPGRRPAVRACSC